MTKSYNIQNVFFLIEHLRVLRGACSLGLGKCFCWFNNVKQCYYKHVLLDGFCLCLFVYFVRFNFLGAFNFSLCKGLFQEKFFRSSHRRCSVKKGVLRNFAKFTVKHLSQSLFFNKVADLNFAKFTGKHLCRSLYFNKVASLGPATLLKRKLWHRCFPVNFT